MCLGVYLKTIHMRGPWGHEGQKRGAQGPKQHHFPVCSYMYFETNQGPNMEGWRAAIEEPLPYVVLCVRGEGVKPSIETDDWD